jgi:copper chaperone CopZ
MKNKIINMVLVLMAIVVLAVLAFSVRVNITPDSVVVMRTLGMTCGSCADKISKALGIRKGVASTEVDTDAGRVIVWYDSKATKAETLAQTLTGAGYGSSVLVSMPAAKYRAMTGKSGATRTSAMTGCGSRCCAEN